MGVAYAYTQLRAPHSSLSRTVFAFIIFIVLVGANACVPALPEECESCSYVASLIQNPAAFESDGTPTTTPTAGREDFACSLNSGVGAVSGSEASFTIVSTPNPTGLDGASALVADYDALYVGGYESLSLTDLAWRIEKRSRVDGTLIASFGTGGAITSNPSTRVDQVSGMAIDESGIYIVGSDLTPGVLNGQWRIEKRDRSTGGLVAGFGTGGIVTENISGDNDSINAIAVDGSGIYLLGFRGTGPTASEWRIEKRDLTSGALITAFNTTGFVNSPAGPGLQTRARAVAIDGSFLYAAGTANAGDDKWRVEKRNLSDGALVAAFGTAGQQDSNPSAGGDGATRVAVDANSIYVSGTDSTASGQLRVERRDIVSGALVPAFDTDGILTVDPSGLTDSVTALDLDSGSVFLGGFDRGVADGQVRISKYSKAAGAPDTAFDGDGILQINPTAGNDQINDLCVDSSFVYAVGDTGTGTAQDWYIIKRNKTTGL